MTLSPTSIRELRELSLTEDGDLAIGPDGDFAQSLGEDALGEHIMIRVRTYFNEAAAMPSVGSRLGEFAGRPNVRETGLEAETATLEALTRDKFMEADAVAIIATASDPTTLEVHIYLDPDREGWSTASISFEIDLVTGTLT